MVIEEIGIKILKKCTQLSKKHSKNFHGLGFVISTKDVMKKLTLSLRPSMESKFLKEINKNTTIDYVARMLVKLSTSNNFHDGFHFLDKKSNFIGICRVLLVKKVDLRPNEKRGVRFYVAKIFSIYKNVKFVGILSQDRSSFYFINGNEFKLKDVLG